MLLELLKEFCVQTVSSLGYPGVFVLMLLNSALVPVPSEIILPFAGYLSSQGIFEFGMLLIYATTGSFVGSVLAYYLGLKFGRSFLKRYGKFVLITERKLLAVERFFQKYGDVSVFLGRLLPGLRTVISVPAGIGRMDFKKFCIYTLLGSSLWNLMFAYLGKWMGENWEKVETILQPIKFIIILLLLAILLFFLRRRLR